MRRVVFPNMIFYYAEVIQGEYMPLRAWFTLAREADKGYAAAEYQRCDLVASPVGQASKIGEEEEGWAR